MVVFPPQGNTHTRIPTSTLSTSTQSTSAHTIHLSTHTIAHSQALTTRCLIQQQQLDTQGASGEGLEASQRVVLRALSSQLQQLRSQQGAWRRALESYRERMATLAATLPTLPPCQWLDLVHSLLEAPLGEEGQEERGAFDCHATLALFATHGNDDDTLDSSGIRSTPQSYAAALCALLRRQLEDVARAGVPTWEEGGPSQHQGELLEALTVVACTIDVLAGDIARLEAAGGGRRAPGAQAWHTVKRGDMC